MIIDSHEVLQKIDAHLELYISATLQSVSEKLGIPGQEIEQILSEIEHKSFHEFQENKRLSQAFEMLGTIQSNYHGPWKEQRSRPRIFVPWTIVKYSVHSNGICESDYSNRCPVASLNISGLAFLADEFLEPGNLILLSITLPKRKEILPVKGYILYSVTTSIANYRYRVGVKFMPFAKWEHCNSPKVLDILDKFEKDYHVFLFLKEK